MTEQQMHNAVIAWLRKEGLMFIHHRMDKRSGIQVGMPDFCVTHCGRCIFLELKQVKGRLSKDQERVIGMLRKNGNRVEVCWTVEAAVDAIKDWLGVETGKGSWRDENGVKCGYLGPAHAWDDKGFCMKCGCEKGSLVGKFSCSAEFSDQGLGPANPLTIDIPPRPEWITTIMGVDKVCTGDPTPGGLAQIVRTATPTDLRELTRI